MPKVNNIINIIIALVAVLSLAFYSYSIVKTCEICFLFFSLAMSISLISITVFIVVLITRHVKSDRLAVVLVFVFSLIALGTWNLIVNVQLTNDYEMLWNAAKQIVEGSFINRLVRRDDIFVFCNYLTGYAYYLSILNRLCSGSILAVGLIRLAVFALTDAILYKTLRIFNGVNASLCGTLIFILYPFIFVGSGLTNNQHEALLFEALSIYLFLKFCRGGRIKIWGWMLLGLVVSIAAFFRPSSVVVLVAIVVLSILRSLTEKDHSLFWGALCLILVYCLVGYIANAFFIVTGLAPYGIKADNLWYKLILGLTGEGMTHQVTVDSEHTNFYFDLQFYGFDYDLYREAAFRYVKSLIMNRQINVSTLFYKMIWFAGNIDNQYTFFDSDFLKQHQLIIPSLNVLGMGIYFVSVILSAVRCATEKIISRSEVALPALIFVGYFLIHIVFEVQTRYRYEQYYVLFLLAVPTMVNIFSVFRNKGIKPDC